MSRPLIQRMGEGANARIAFSNGRDSSASWNSTVSLSRLRDGYPSRSQVRNPTNRPRDGSPLRRRILKRGNFSVPMGDSVAVLRMFWEPSWKVPPTAIPTRSKCIIPHKSPIRLGKTVKSRKTTPWIKAQATKGRYLARSLRIYLLRIGAKVLRHIGRGRGRHIIWPIA